MSQECGEGAQSIQPVRELSQHTGATLTDKIAGYDSTGKRVTDFGNGSRKRTNYSVFGTMRFTQDRLRRKMVDVHLRLHTSEDLGVSGKMIRNAGQHAACRRQNRVRLGTMPFVLLSWLLPCGIDTSAADWPQWRYDANRSGATNETGPEDATALWSKRLPHPDPAYDHQYRMCADVASAPIAAEGLAFVPSNVTDDVTALDLQTGKLKWRYITEGPVRFAPVYSDGKVCFGSDDGHLYCVSAIDGNLRWKVRGVPRSNPDCRMIVNGRLCSRWPVRGAPVARDGVVYFGSGIWPEEGVSVCAIQIETGKFLWRSDRMSYVKDGMSDHGRSYDLSLPPQGYLAFIDGRLAVPSGRSLAAWFDPSDGAMEPYTCFYVKHNPPRGTWHLSGINQYCVQGGNWFATRPDAEPPLPPDLKDAKSALYWSKEPPENELYVIKNRPFLRADAYRLHPENLYTDPVLTETTLYASEFDAEEKYLVPRGHTHISFPDYDCIVARDLTIPQWRSATQPHVAYGRRKVTLPKLEFPIIWELKSPLRVLIKAGDRLYAGGNDTIAAIDIPKKGEEPSIAWRKEIDGIPVHALVANGKLLVSTHNGNLFCFGEGSGQEPTSATTAAIEADGPYQSPRDGFALLFGYGDGTRAKSLVTEKDYRVVVVEPDSAKAAKAAAALALNGLGGRHVQIIQSDLLETLITPYWANLVVIQSLDGFRSPQRALSVALDALRPHTGMLVLPDANQNAVPLEPLLSARTGYTVTREATGITVRRQSAPDGADDWTHEAGGPDNCFANSDRLVKWPFGVLWYSGDIDRFFSPPAHFQHERHPYPLVVGGRMFLITGQILHAIDIYTGSYLWKAEMPMTPWIQTRYFDSRLYGRPTERNCVAAVDRVYAVTGETIRAYDAQTGKLMKVFGIPSQLRDKPELVIAKPQELTAHGYRGTVQAAPPWTEIRLWDNSLLTVLGSTLAAIDRHSGDVLWMRPSTSKMTTYVLSDDTLFGLDYEVPKMGGGDADGDRPGLLFALNPATGTTLWEKPVAYAPTPKHSTEHARPWLRPIIPELSYNAKHQFIVMAVNRNSIRVFHAADGSDAWSKANAATGHVLHVYSPAVLDDYLLISDYKGCYGYLLDIRTGEEMGESTGIPRPRTCARILGNNNLLVYRDAATELYDILNNRMIGLNSLRSGCTTSFIPAGGVMTAPMLGHGCVCNYPMFASLALYHFPEIEDHRPASVTSSWVNEAEPLLAQNEPSTSKTGSNATDVFNSSIARRIDLRDFQLINSTLRLSNSGLLFSTKDKDTGYALQKLGKPASKSVFTFSVKRAQGPSGKGRHGNAFFACGASDRPEDLIECRLYYGGRSSLMISGSPVEHAEEKASFNRQAVFEVTVTVDCVGRTVTFETAGKKLTSRITGPVEAITHYGYGGANSDNYFTDITVR